MRCLIRIYTICHLFLILFFWNPCWGCGHFKIQRWKSPLEKHRDERVIFSTSLTGLDIFSGETTLSKMFLSVLKWGLCTGKKVLVNNANSPSFPIPPPPLPPTITPPPPTHTHTQTHTHTHTCTHTCTCTHAHTHTSDKMSCWCSVIRTYACNLKTQTVYWVWLVFAVDYSLLQGQFDRHLSLDLLHFLSIKNDCFTGVYIMLMMM